MAKISKKVEGEELLEKEVRIYTVEELERFNTLIQKYKEPYTFETGPWKGQTKNVLNHKKLAIAYGATDKKGSIFLERFEQYQNLWNQHNEYQDKKAWIAEQQNLEWEKATEEMAKQKVTPPVVAPEDPALEKW